jgi:hypothetical protein
MARLRAPAASGEVLAAPGFDAIPAPVEANRRLLDRDDILVGGLSLREIRAIARREVLEAAGFNGESGAPLLLAGHQPELSHPGVWVKSFALNGLARRLGGTPLHLIVDTDTLKSTSLRFPVLPGHGHKVRMETLPFDRSDGESTYECRSVLDRELLRTFPTRAAALCGNWGYEPLLLKVWRTGRNIGETFTAIRRDCERRWGCYNLELPVSRVAGTAAFAHFARHILDDLARFREVYNSALLAYRKANRVRSDNHPAPLLAEGEAPFWVRTSACRRERATATSDVNNLRPRALTLTLFARLCLGDFFIHGIGGGKYDEVTDAIIRGYYGLEPPAYQVLSATLHLPLPAFPTTFEDVYRAERRVRDLSWNPQGFVTDRSDLVERHAALAASEPPYRNRAARRAWFRDLRDVKEQLRARVADRLPEAEREAARARADVEANAILKRRDYAWVLYPEETLKPFLTRLL